MVPSISALNIPSSTVENNPNPSPSPSPRTCLDLENPILAVGSGGNGFPARHCCTELAAVLSENCGGNDPTAVAMLPSRQPDILLDMDDEEESGFWYDDVRGGHLKENRFPPPISSMARLGYHDSSTLLSTPAYSLRHYKGSGRFVLQEVKAPRERLLRARRENGRLTMELVNRTHDDDDYIKLTSIPQV